MCGIAGFLNPDTPWSAERAAAVADAMASAIAHRGPDDEGTWADPASGVALGHRRLSIIDLSETGRQPMTSRDGRYVISYNGEIYNFLELRRQLEMQGAAFGGASDTEVLLEAIAHWGLERALEQVNGMFAFAVWDRVGHVLHLARDRAGEKPLYYGRVGRSVIFGSELKALRRFPGFDPALDLDALGAFLRYSYVPSPSSIYEGIRKLPPGTSLTIAADGTLSRVRPYWSLIEVAERGRHHRLALDDHEVTAVVEEALSESVRLRMLADVPVGAFLSGGVDSSTVVALMQAHSASPVRTFTIGFGERDYDEAAHAAAVAGRLGTDHTELRATAEDVLGLVPSLPEAYDEPFADSSQLPTMLVSALTRKSVTVGLSGDAGDELFGGYVRHARFEDVLRYGSRFPKAVRATAGAGLASVRPATWDRLAKWFEKVSRRSVVAHAGEKAHKLARILRADGPTETYDVLAATWTGSVPGLARTSWGAPAAAFAATPEELTLTERVMLSDGMTYLPDDILTKVDRASMAFSLETRIPMLDHHLVELAWRLPIEARVRPGRPKWLLREILARYVPRQVTDRPKMGFAVPLADWLRGPLHEWAADHLSESQLRQKGHFDSKAVASMWDEHLAGDRDHSPALWSILTFLAWGEHQRSITGASGDAG